MQIFSWKFKLFERPSATTKAHGKNERYQQQQHIIILYLWIWFNNFNSSMRDGIFSFLQFRCWSFDFDIKFLVPKHAVNKTKTVQERFTAQIGIANKTNRFALWNWCPPQFVHTNDYCNCQLRCKINDAFEWQNEGKSKHTTNATNRAHKRKKMLYCRTQNQYRKTQDTRSANGRETIRNSEAKVHLNATNTWTLLMMTTLTVCEQIFVFSIPSFNRIVLLWPSVRSIQHSAVRTHCCTEQSMFDAVTHLCSILHAMPTNGCARLVMLVFIHSHNRERARGAHSTWTEWTFSSNSSQRMYPQCSVCVRKEEGSIGESGRCSRLNIEPTTGKSLPGTMWMCVYARFSATVYPLINEKRLWSPIFFNRILEQTSSVSAWFICTQYVHSR